MSSNEKISDLRLDNLIAWFDQDTPDPTEKGTQVWLALRELRAYRKEGWVLVPRNTLIHWMEYWNGSRNETAMFDALDHIMDELLAVLPAAPQPQEGP